MTTNYVNRVKTWAISGALMLGAVFLLTGCDEDKKALAQNPQVIAVGTFENCKVSYVNKGFDTLSFYIAKCPGEATTVTNNRMVQQGKTQVFQRTTTITEIDSALQSAKQEVADLEAKRAALSKLNQREKELLGIAAAASSPAN